MLSPTLAHAPLVEAILEIRWRLRTDPKLPGAAFDPKYKLLVGRLYDQLKTDYPFHEPLPTALMPDEMLNYLVQHRFRTAANRWPLIQVGPGIVTLNDTEAYNWDDFSQRGQRLLQCLSEVYPDETWPLTVVGLQLRYIDAIAFDFSAENVFEFISTHLKVQMGFASPLFADTPIQPHPESLDMAFNFPTTLPQGICRLHFARGHKNGQDALIWETIVMSEGADLFKTTPDDFHVWLTGAHDLTHTLFFKMISGPLEAKFQ
jgi:uncharacterized protein (TIGR04255 family)